MCLCSCLSYPACKSYLLCAVLYFHLWPICLHRIFPHYVINGKLFGRKKLLNIKRVFWFSLQLLSETFLIQRRFQRDAINVHKSSCKVPVIVVRFQLSLNFLHGFWTILKYQISWKSAQWEPSCSMRTDRHDEANRRFWQCCESAWKKDWTHLAQDMLP